MTLPSLRNWEATRDAFHQVSAVVGALRVACSEPLPNDLHFSVDVTTTGITSSRLTFGGEIRFDFDTLRVAYVRGKESIFTVDLEGHSQVSLMQKLLAVFGERGYTMQPSMKHITHESEFAIDRSMAADYLLTLNAVYTALARFRAKLSGFMTPLVLWPHHFDLGFLWFPSDATNEHSDPQISFGFAPFSEGLDRPYFYAYSWSKPTGYVEVPLDAPAQAITEGYTGLFAAYDELRNTDDFNAAIADMLLDYQGLVVPQLV